MKPKLQNSVIAFLMLVLSAITADAQKTMDVTKFSRIDNDLMARVTKPIRDKDKGKLCALIRVVTTLTNLEIRADALGIVHQEKHAGELWLYVPSGARRISFSHDGFFPLLYQYELPIDEGTVYEAHLTSFDTSNNAIAQNSATQLFVLSHHPDEATVYIDGVEVPTKYGVFAAMMSKGEHTYKVTADKYEDAEGSFTLDDQTERETVTLNPLFGTFQLFTLPDNGFNVSINSEKVGVSPYKSGQLDPGSYRVHIDKEKYYPVDTLIRLREGDNKELTIKLTSRDDSLFYKRILGGHNVSFGVTAGYLFPFVSSSAGGGYTGSPINYSIGDSRENVDYTSQSGFTAGIFTDIRLYKNIYINSGINYTHIKYSNNFSQLINDAFVDADENYVYLGNVKADYKENYTFNMIEIPILVSYRFVLSKNSSLQLNLGPYFNFGLSAKMKVSGSAESEGNTYGRWGLVMDSTPLGDFYANNHLDTEFDLYSKDFEFKKTYEYQGGSSRDSYEKYVMESKPYNRFNYGLKAGITYELRGFQLGIGYSFQLSNMGNTEFWESTRIPIINGQVGTNNMSGYKHRIHTLELKLGYVFRY